MSPIRSLLDRLLSRLTQIGADPQDDDDTRASKTLLVLISVLILPVSLLWAALYLAFGSPVGWVPLVYFAILLAAIVVFSRTGDFGRFLLIGQIAILLAPTLSMIPLGGFLESGGSACGGPRAARGARVQRRSNRGSLVRRVRRRIPLLWDRRRAAWWRVAGGPRVVHEHDACSQRDGGRHDRVHAARRVRRPAPERARGVTR